MQQFSVPDSEVNGLIHWLIYSTLTRSSAIAVIADRTACSSTIG